MTTPVSDSGTRAGVWLLFAIVALVVVVFATYQMTSSTQGLNCEVDRTNSMVNGSSPSRC